MKFYPNRYSETHLIFVDDETDDTFEYSEEYTYYRFSGRFPDYAAIKKELRNFIDIWDPLGFDSVERKEYYDLPGLIGDPRKYGKIYDQLFVGHNLKYIIIIRRISYYWFTLEIFEDKLSNTFRKIIALPRSEEECKSLDDILKGQKPIKSFRFNKFK